MKKAFAIIPFLLLCMQLLGQVTEITFDHRAWNEILAQAKTENKMVFLDANTSWCHPCKWMAATTFKNPDIAALFNANFVNAKIDMEKGEGPALRAQYGVMAFPTLLFVDGDGNLVHSLEGALDVTELTALAHLVLDPDFNSLVKMDRRFADGERDRAFLKEYLLRLSPESETFAKVFEPFAPGMAGEGLLEENSWAVFQACFQDPQSESASYFLAHRQTFEAQYGVVPVQEKAASFYYAMGQKAAAQNNPKAFGEARGAAVASGLRGAEALCYRMEIDWCRCRQDVPLYIEACNRLFKTPEGKADIREKNFQAWMISVACEKKEELRQGLKWSQDVVKVQQDYAALKNLALLQLKLGKTKQGMATAQKAIAMAKAEGEEYEETTAAMEKYGANEASK